MRIPQSYLDSLYFKLHAAFDPYIAQGVSKQDDRIITNLTLFILALAVALIFAVGVLVGAAL